MQRSIFIRNAALTAGGLLLAQKNLLANLMQQPAYKIKMLHDDFGIFTESGGTIAFLLSKSGIVVVDAQFPDPAKHLIAELQKQSQQPFKLLINTHHHGDHTAGNISFKGLVEHVLAHENSKTNQENVAKAQKKEDVQLYPDKTFTDTWTEKIDKETISLSYFGAGHTNGDALIHFERANIVHMGDLVFNRRHPFIDRTAGASISNWMTVLDKAVKKYDSKTVYIFGHSGNDYDVTGNADDLKAYRDYLGNLLKFVGEEIKSGKPKEEIIKATEIPGAPQWKGDGIQRPLTAAFDELTAK